jgi:hypothetical protein
LKSLRTHLVLLVLAAVLPLLVLAVAMMRQQLAEKREIIDNGMQATVRALTSAVDGEVRTSLGILQTLASSPLLDGGDLKAFHVLCTRAMEGRRGVFIVLFDPSGQQLVNSSRPYGSPLPNPLLAAQPPGFDPRYREVPMGGSENVRQVLSTGKPFISNLFVSLVTREPRIGFDIPVVRGGGLRYVLELSLDAAELSRLLAEQGSPDGSMAAIVDRQGIAIASSVNARSNVGKSLAPDLAGQIANSGSGAGTGRDFEGVQVYHVFNASPLTGWKTSLSVARSAAYAPLSSAMTALALAAVLAVLVALGAAIALGRRVMGLVGRTAQERERVP